MFLTNLTNFFLTEWLLLRGRKSLLLKKSILAANQNLFLQIEFVHQSKMFSVKSDLNFFDHSGWPKMFRKL